MVEDAIGGFILTQREERGSQQSGGSKKVGAEGHCLLQGVASLRVASQPKVSQAKVMLDLRGILIETAGFPQRLHSLRVMAVLAVEHAEGGELVSVVRIKELLTRRLCF